MMLSWSSKGYSWGFSVYRTWWGQMVIFWVPEHVKAQ